MFVQATKSKRGNKTYISYLVREAFRTPKGPRSRTVCNLSGLPPDVRDLITAALAGKPCAALESLELESALNYGGLAVLRDAWQRFGLERALGGHPRPAPARALTGHELWPGVVPGVQTGPGRASRRHAVGDRLRAGPTEGALR